MPAGTGKQGSVAIWAQAVPRYSPSENILFTNTGVGRVVGVSNADCALPQLLPTNSCCRIACDWFIFRGPEGLASAGYKNYTLINKYECCHCLQWGQDKTFFLNGEFISLDQPSKIRIPSICS